MSVREATKENFHELIKFRQNYKRSGIEFLHQQ